MSRKISISLLILSVLLFAISLSQKTYCIDENCGENWSGFAILFSGIFGVLSGGACFAWFANPLIFISWITFKKNKTSLIFSIIALIVGISFLFFDEIIKDEAMNYGKITGYNLGFYLWNFSFLAMVVANVIRLKNNQKTK